MCGALFILHRVHRMFIAQEHCSGFMPLESWVEQICHKLRALQSQREIAKALRVFTQEENLPVLVHCMHGKDRTGLIIMLVMLLCDNGAQVALLLLQYYPSSVF